MTISYVQTALQDDSDDDDDDDDDDNGNYLLKCHCTIHYAKRFTYLCHFVLPILDKYYYYLHFAEEEEEAW